MRRHGWSHQALARCAAERNEDVIAGWVKHQLRSRLGR